MLSKLTIQRLRKLEKFLMREPRRFDMNDGVISAYRLDEEMNSFLEEPPCGTACCMAGGAYVLNNKINLSDKEEYPEGLDVDWFNVWNEALNYLGLDALQGQRLFYLKSMHANDKETKHWPVKYERLYLAAKTPMERVMVGCLRIEHFIATSGKQ